MVCVPESSAVGCFLRLSIGEEKAAYLYLFASISQKFVLSSCEAPPARKTTPRMRGGFLREYARILLEFLFSCSSMYLLLGYSAYLLPLPLSIEELTGCVTCLDDGVSE